MLIRHDKASTVVEVTIVLDGESHRVPASLSVAAAVLMLAGPAGFRRHVAGGPRAPLCMMGVCHDCLITIDGAPNRQGCLMPVREGMTITRQADQP